MCYAEGWQTYHRRIRYRTKEALRKFKQNLSLDSDIEIPPRKRIIPRGCPICAYKKKRYGSPYHPPHPKKNKNHHSTAMRLTYRHFAKIKRRRRVFLHN
ncbi:MAG: hypothetical protein ACFFBD_11225 [Candidatus Hodarchaeota archaeon]